MNHLAHLFLSQSDPELMVGNFIADHVKGKKILSFTDKIQKGIRMHRAIDEFTDHHEIVRKSKERLYPTYHKYASVIVDMFYDHILARNWKKYSPIELKSFSNSTYKVLNAFCDSMPQTSQRFLFYMEKGDWLKNYSSYEGIGQALSGLSRRAKFDSKMELAVADLEKDIQDYEAEFEQFFPKLNEYCIEWLKS